MVICFSWQFRNIVVRLELSRVVGLVSSMAGSKPITVLCPLAEAKDSSVLLNAFVFERLFFFAWSNYIKPS